MVPERSELQLPVPAGCLPYPGPARFAGLRGRTCLPLGGSGSDRPVLPDRLGAGRLGRPARSPWPDPFPPSASLARRAPKSSGSRSCSRTSAVPGLSDSPRSFIGASFLSDLRRGPRRCGVERGASRLPREVLACVPGVCDPAGSRQVLRWRPARRGLPSTVNASAPRMRQFRDSIPSPHVPLSTLRPRPHERVRMTRGRCGSLHLHRMELSSTTPHRLCRRTTELTPNESAQPLKGLRHLHFSHPQCRRRYEDYKPSRCRAHKSAAGAHHVARACRAAHQLLVG